MDVTKERLLSRDSESQDDEHDRPVYHRRKGLRSWAVQNYLQIIIIVLLLYIAVVLTATSWDQHMASTSCHEMGRNSHMTRLGGMVEYEQKPEYIDPWSPWNSGPSDEQDDAWDHLLYAQNVRVTQEEVQFLGFNTTNRVQVTDGDYIAVVGVYHHLHCLDSIRMALHKAYYAKMPGFNIDAETLQLGHSDHCIDTIRQALMCHANTDLYTAEWVADSHTPENKAFRTTTSTTCVKWEAVDGWARERALRNSHYKFIPGPFEN